MEATITDLQTRFLRIIESELEKKNAATQNFNTAHQLCQTNVTARLLALNNALVAQGGVGNFTDLNLAIAAYQAALGAAADPALVTPLPEPVNTYVINPLVQRLANYEIMASTMVSSLAVCSISALMLPI